MAQIRFEWDEASSLANQGRHGMSFEEAVHVFLDPLHVSIQDRVESRTSRWQTFGLVDGLLVMLEAQSFREEEDREIIRILSARRATFKERRFYDEEHNQPR